MYEVFTEMHFSAAHHLREYNGACANVHGHNWQIRATVQAEKLDALGIAVDFKTLKRALHEVIDPLDHIDLNSVFTEAEGNPTAENIARYIFEKIAPKINAENSSAQITRIDIWETSGNCVSYFDA